ncbi:hypothetical protein ASF62_16335 [Leifsonia sp. Leaf325]|nr:hypothetical protein [Leifsonia sp. Leaf325]KQQ93274.1 hypothetical protein ASF62_16335 [Leifsonia sp. Leaf325]
MIVGLIVACEIGFWVAVVSGLVARYVLRMPRLGLVLLAAAPAIDVVLLIATAVHLKSGAQAEWAHGLAALYIGFSVAYGHRLIAWADARFAQRFAGGEPAPKLTGAAYTRTCWADLARTVLGAGIAGAILFGLTWWVDDPARTLELQSWYPILLLVVGIDAVWAISYTLWPRKAGPAASASPSGT